MSIKAVNRNSKWWRRQSWHRSVKKCGQSVKYCSATNQLKWEVSNWSKQLASITTSGFSYCNFVSDEVSMEICWQSDEYVLLLKAILLTRQRTKISTNTISCCYLASASSTHVPQSETSLSYLCSSIFTRPLNTGILGIWHTWYLSTTINFSHYCWYIGTQSDIIFSTITKNCLNLHPRKPLFVSCFHTKGTCSQQQQQILISIIILFTDGHRSGYQNSRQNGHNMPDLLVFLLQKYVDKY